MQHILNLEITSDKFNNTCVNSKINAFIIYYLNTKYIITYHNFIPINSICDNDNNRLKILLDSITSDVLILEYLPIYDDIYKINNKYLLKIPVNNSICYILYKHKYNIIIEDCDFISYNNITSEYKLPYIIGRFIDEYNDILDILGLPVYINNKLIGMISKYDNDKILILPIYIIIKNILNIDDNFIYTINNIEHIKKINNKFIIKNYIYNIKLKINIPINTFLLIEGNKNSNLLIKYTNCDTTTNYCINNTFDIINNRNIIYKIKNELIHYKITIRLLNLIIACDMNISEIVINYLGDKDITSLWLYIKINNEIIIYSDL